VHQNALCPGAKFKKNFWGRGIPPSPVPTPTGEGDTFPQTLLPRGLRPLDRPSPTHPPPLADHFKHWVSLQLCTFVEKNWGCSSVDFYTIITSSALAITCAAGQTSRTTHAWPEGANNKANTSSLRQFVIAADAQYFAVLAPRRLGGLL